MHWLYFKKFHSILDTHNAFLRHVVSYHMMLKGENEAKTKWPTIKQYNEGNSSIFSESRCHSLKPYPQSTEAVTDAYGETVGKGTVKRYWHLHPSIPLLVVHPCPTLHFDVTKLHDIAVPKLRK